MAINGRTYDWESIEITGPGGRIVGAQNVNYKDNAKSENVYGIGRYPLGRSRGNYEASGSLDMLRKDADALIGALGADYLGKADFTVSVSYANDGGDVTTDTLVKAVVTEQDQGMDQGAKAAVMKFSLSMEKILWNGKEPVVKK